MKIGTPVPLLQNHVEFHALLDIYRRRKPQRILEVGTYHGGTLYHWLKNAAKSAVVVSIDSYETGVDNRSLYPEWCPESVILHVLCGDSRNPDIIQRVATRAPYDWCFIDADHSYGGVKADWENYGPLVDGLVCFHDINSLTGVPQLWQEIKDQGYQTDELIGPHEPGEPGWGLGPDTPWGGIGICHTPL